MFGRIFLTALAAGLLSGIFIWGAHSIKITPLILAAEVYENAPAPATADGPGQLQQEAAGQGGGEWAPADGFERSAFTLLTDVLTSIGFAFLLVGAITLSGREVDWRRGVVWGLAGFAAFDGRPPSSSARTPVEVASTKAVRRPRPWSPAHVPLTSPVAGRTTASTPVKSPLT